MDSIGSNNGMQCQICDQKYHTIYSVDDELWIKVTGATEQEDAPGYFSGLWCPHCFSREARVKGITVRWSCAEEWPHEAVNKELARVRGEPKANQTLLRDAHGCGLTDPEDAMNKRIEVMLRALANRNVAHAADLLASSTPPGREE